MIDSITFFLYLLYITSTFHNVYNKDCDDTTCTNILKIGRCENKKKGKHIYSYTQPKVSFHIVQTT